MRLLIVSPNGHIPDAMSGQAVGQHELALALVAAGHDVTLLTAMAEGERQEAAYRDTAMGYPIWWVRDTVAAYPWVAAAFAPTCVILQSAPVLPTLMAVARAIGIPTIVWLHAVEMYRIHGSLPDDPFFRYLSASCFGAARMRAWHGITCDVMVPLVDPTRHFVAETGAAITFINPMPEKGFEIFLSIVRGAPELHYLVAESWRVNARQRAEMTSRLPPGHHIEWRQRVLDMRPVWARTRVLLVPSVWEETWGRVVSEAQVSAIPVIASDRGGLHESVGPGGIMMPADSPAEAWIATIRAVLNEPAAWPRLSDAARAHAARPHFQPVVMVEDLMAEIARHVARGARP